MTNLLKKKWIALLTLAVMMISLLAGFSVSGLFEPDGKKHYYISNASQWKNLATYGVDSDVTVHLRGDISFDEEGVFTPIQNFAATLDGHGYSIRFIDGKDVDKEVYKYSSTSSVALFKTLSGTVKNLTVAGSCSLTSTNSTAASIAVTMTSTAKILNCGSSAVINGGTVYGLVANAASGAEISGCFFAGTVNGSSVATFAGGSPTVTNSVCGTTAYTTAGTSKACASITEAAYTVNQTDGAYFSYGYGTDQKETVFKIGSVNDQIVKATINGNTSYYDTGDETELETIDGKTPVVTSGKGFIHFHPATYSEGVLVKDAYHSLIIANEDVVMEYQDTATVELAAAKAEMNEMIAAFGQMNSAYFSNYSAMQTWATEAEAMVNTASLADLQTKIANGKSLPSLVGGVGYIPISEYPIYKFASNVKDYSIGSKADWLKAVELSNFYEDPNATNFVSKRLHLTADIDMENTEMMPLSYFSPFGGNLNGHDHTIKNININIDTAWGPVGLVGQMGSDATVQNLRLVGGSIAVTGNPVYSIISGCNKHEGNKVGGIAGRNGNRGLLRKCLVDVDFSVQRADSLAGIVADARSAGFVDGCIVLGEVGSYGIVAYGGNSCTVTNCVYGGSSAATNYHGNVIGGHGLNGWENKLINVYAFKEIFHPNTTVGCVGDYAEDYSAEDKLAYNQFNADHQCNNMLEALYAVEQNYAHQEKGDKAHIYFALDENGIPTFGDENKRIIKISVVDTSETKLGEYYANSNDTVDLFYTMGRNYYAVAAGDAVIKNKILYTKGVGDITLKVADNVTGGDAYMPKDGKVNLMDAQMVLRASVGLNEELVDKVAGDVNFDAKLGADDAVLLVRYWLGDKANYDPTAYAPEEGGWFTVATYNIKVMDWEGPAPVLKEGLETGNTYHSYATTGITNHQLVPLADEVAAVINSVGGVDLLGLQEVNDYNIETLKTKLGGNWNAEHAWASDHSTYNYGTAVMTPHTIGSSSRGEYLNQYGVLYSKAVERRAYGRYEVTVNEGQADEFNIIWYNTHLGTMVEEQFAELMVEAQKDYAAGKKIIITADFNYWPTGMQKYLKGNFTMANGGEAGRSFETTTAVTGTAIDNIIISNNLEFYVDDHGSAAHVVSYDDLTDAEKSGHDQTWASDHNLVYAYVRVKK